MRFEVRGAGTCGLGIRKHLKSFQGQATCFPENAVNLTPRRTEGKMPKPGNRTQIILMANQIGSQIFAKPWKAALKSTGFGPLWAF